MSYIQVGEAIEELNEVIEELDRIRIDDNIDRFEIVSQLGFIRERVTSLRDTMAFVQAYMKEN